MGAISSRQSYKKKKGFKINLTKQWKIGILLILGCAIPIILVFSFGDDWFSDHTERINKNEFDEFNDAVWEIFLDTDKTDFENLPNTHYFEPVTEGSKVSAMSAYSNGYNEVKNLLNEYFGFLLPSTFIITVKDGYYKKIWEDGGYFSVDGSKYYGNFVIFKIDGSSGGKVYCLAEEYLNMGLIKEFWNSEMTIAIGAR